MSARRSYATALDAIGLYVERAGGADVFVNEIEGGFLVAFVDGSTQHVVTLDAAEMARLQSDAARHRGSARRGLLGRGAGLRERLHCLGRHLDERVAAAIVVQQRADGFTTEYTGLPHGPGDPVGLERLHETLDNRQLRAQS